MIHRFTKFSVSRLPLIFNNDEKNTYKKTVIFKYRKCTALIRFLFLYYFVLLATHLLISFTKITTKDNANTIPQDDKGSAQVFNRI